MQLHFNIVFDIFFRNSETEESIDDENANSNELFENETEPENDNSHKIAKKQLTIQVCQNISFFNQLHFKHQS